MAKSAATPVDVRCDGDDGLTQRVCAAVQNGFKSSQDFTLTSADEPGMLVVRIPTNVDWKQMGKRTKVLYKIEFTTANDQKIAASKGSCWEDAISKCVDQIVEKAKIATRKMGSAK